ncbi:MAG: DUF1836 domain-containing protein [Ruminococcaceae bacterium]|nr:DUF1836 domain-containing protein [Oscillospiraceae bacterium]
MNATFPGTTIEVTKLEKGSTQALFDGIFATGGITLSQVSIMTGLEPYLIQNWVKRGFVTHPTGRIYSREQFARIVIINMLRETLQIERICTLIHIIGGKPEDKSDDLIGDDILYHKYVDMLADENINIMDESSVNAAVDSIAQDFDVHEPCKKKQLAEILKAMLYAHAASELKSMSSSILSDLS